MKTKLHADDSLEHLKALLLEKDYNQVDGVNYHETFSSVIQKGTIVLFFSVALVKNWEIWQLDVKNASLNDIL